jgi:hypothetical protein
VQAFYGTTADNPATAADESGFTHITVDTSLPGGTDVGRTANVSRNTDYDQDGVAAIFDLCDADPWAALSDPDGDSLAGSCDPNPSSLDNDFDSVIEIAATAYPWDDDQDVDADGIANFFDNCPNTPNPDHRDTDRDTAGDACDPVDEFGNHIPNGTDSDHLCFDAATSGAPEPFEPDYAGMVCFSADSDDDGVDDFSPLAPDGAGGLGQRDVNSDADKDGVSDAEETDGDGNCDGNPLDADSVIEGVRDGVRLGPAPPQACWRYDATQNGTTGLDPNGEGSPDSDGDGCSNRRESLLVDAAGGNRDALNPYDFLDVPAPANGPVGTDGKLTLSTIAVRNKAVSLTDIGVILAYVGRTSTNAGAAYYNGDLNRDGLADGPQMDRTAGLGNAETAGNLAISLADVGVALDHVGDSCTASP